MSAYRNVTFDELEIGATAGARRALTQTEIEALVLVSGDIEPFHMEDAGDTTAGLLCVDAVGVGAVISGLLERKLPGPGTRIVSQQFEFSGVVQVGEELAASVTVREKQPHTGLVVFDCDARVGDRRVLWGTAVVEAPRRRLTYSDIATPEIVLRRNDVFARLLRQCEPLEPVVCAVVHPCERDALIGSLDAAKSNLMTPILVGPAAKNPRRRRGERHRHHGLLGSSDRAQPRRGGGGRRAGARGRGRAADEGQPAHRRTAGRGGRRATPACAPSGASAMSS